jgi:hypothetical protein
LYVSCRQIQKDQEFEARAEASLANLNDLARAYLKIKFEKRDGDIAQW